jgi:hypothetical protein
MINQLIQQLRDSIINDVLSMFQDFRFSMMRDIREALATPSGIPLRIADNVEFASPVKFEEISETPLEVAVRGDVTPSVLNITRIRFTNTGPIMVTNFDNGQEGQYIIVVGDGQTTVQNSPNIFTTSGANLLLANGRVYAFVRTLGVWREQGGAPVPNLSPLSSVLATPVVIAAAGTYYNVLSLNLGIGVWLVQGQVLFRNSSGAECRVVARLREGTTNYSSVESILHNRNPNLDTVPIQALISTPSNITLSLQATSDLSGTCSVLPELIAPYANGLNATNLIAIKVG